MGCGENGLRVGIGWGKGCDLLQRLKGREGAQVLVVRAMVDVQLALQFSMTDEKMEKMGGRDSNT